MPIPAPSRDSKLLRFGIFEADLSAGELRKNGGRVRLQEQPFQVLATLLNNAGHVVTREDLREKIWPADTFVDFDHSLNTAVNKIREALGDSASSPRFIETLARRGYRFIAPVSGFQSLPSSPSDVPREPSVSPGEVPLHPDLHVPFPRRGVVRALFGLLQVMYLSFYVAALSHLHGIDRIASSLVPDWAVRVILIAVLMTGAAGTPLRLYLLSAVAFDFRRLGDTFRRLFPFVLVLDQLWAITPLLLPRIEVGIALLTAAALLYVPFSERTLIRMAYPVQS